MAVTVDQPSLLSISAPVPISARNSARNKRACPNTVRLGVCGSFMEVVRWGSDPIVFWLATICKDARDGAAGDYSGQAWQPRSVKARRDYRREIPYVS
jgi:hypothetical protein